MLLLRAAVIGYRYAKSRVQKSLLAHTLVQHLIAENGLVEHNGVGLKGDRSTRSVGIADDGDRLGYAAAGELHLVYLPALVHLNGEPFGEGVYDRGADAVETAGYLIAAAAEFSARVQYGENDLESRLSGLLLDIDGYAASVIRYRDGVALVYRNGYIRAVAGKRLVDGVVDYLVNEVVKTG